MVPLFTSPNSLVLFLPSLSRSRLSDAHRETLGPSDTTTPLHFLGETASVTEASLMLCSSSFDTDVWVSTFRVISVSWSCLSDLVFWSPQCCRCSSCNGNGGGLPRLGVWRTTTPSALVIMRVVASGDVSPLSYSLKSDSLLALFTRDRSSVACPPLSSADSDISTWKPSAITSLPSLTT